MANSLWKTTIVIWSETDPTGAEIDDIARDAIDGESFCSVQMASLIEEPTSDRDWIAGAESFFAAPDDLLQSTDQRKFARD